MLEDAFSHCDKQKQKDEEKLNKLFVNGAMFHPNHHRHGMTDTIALQYEEFASWVIEHPYMWNIVQDAFKLSPHSTSTAPGMLRRRSESIVNLANAGFQIQIPSAPLVFNGKQGQFLKPPPTSLESPSVVDESETKFENGFQMQSTQSTQSHFIPMGEVELSSSVNMQTSPKNPKYYSSNNNSQLLIDNVLDPRVSFSEQLCESPTHLGRKKRFQSFSGATTTQQQQRRKSKQWNEIFGRRNTFVRGTSYILSNGKNNFQEAGGVQSVDNYERQLQFQHDIPIVPDMRGFLFKQGKRFGFMVKRWYLLHNSFLYVFKNSYDTEPKHVILLNGCSISEYPSNVIVTSDTQNENDGRINSIKYQQPPKKTAKSSQSNAQNDDKMQFGIEIIVGVNTIRQQHKILFAKTKKEQQQWIAALKSSADAYVVDDFFDIKEKIGSGKFSKVHKAIDKKNGQPYAVKIIERKTLTLRENQALRTEIAVLRLLNHPNVVSIEHVFETIDNICIVMQYSKGGDLFDKIIQYKRFDEIVARRIVWKLLNVVYYLHRRGVVHRDLKPENILCVFKDDNNDKNISSNSSSGNVIENKGNEDDIKTNDKYSNNKKRDQSDLLTMNILVIDFGLSSFFTPKQMLRSPCGTLSYVAPEVLRNHGYGKEVDLWSIGVILYVMIRGRLPFDSKDKSTLIKKIVNGKFSFKNEIWKSVSFNCKDIIIKLLNTDSSKRLTAAQALKHPWFHHGGMSLHNSHKMRIKDNQKVAVTFNDAKKPKDSNIVRHAKAIVDENSKEKEAAKLLKSVPESKAEDTAKSQNNSFQNNVDKKTKSF